MNGDDIVNATVQIRYGGEPVGSGFRFLYDDIIITSAHTLSPITENVPITASVDQQTEVELELVDVSPEPRGGGHDYAVLQTTDGISPEREVLQPRNEDPSRGEEVYFAGHPFDTANTLLHTAIVSGPHNHGFYLDGSVNLGNSGGPIVDKDSGEVVGIVTESQVYQSQSLEEAINYLNTVQQQLLRIQEVHETTINRVSVEDLAMDSIQEMQKAIDILTDNVSSGIGVGYSIKPIVDDLSDLDF
jgi:S1-C subfamily serine protease